MRGVISALCACVMLAGCVGESIWAPDDVVAKSIYRHDGPPKLTLYTMINNRTGKGAHTSLMINGSQRVIFDPAGSFKHETIPERNDVIFGATPVVADVYTRYHARQTFHVKVQELIVTPQQAEKALNIVMNYGAVAKAQCAHGTSRVLAQVLPGQVTPTWYPKALAEEFGAIPGVKQQELFEYDSDDNSKVLEAWDPARYKAQQ